jgi:hypothetical protein
MSYGDLIRILPDLEPSETLATFVHELAPEMLHRGERRTLTTKTVRETEAKAVAFVVCHALGLETGTSSSDYIHRVKRNKFRRTNTGVAVSGAVRCHPFPSFSYTCMNSSVRAFDG